MPNNKIRSVIAVMVVGLYVVATLTILVWCVWAKDVGAFMEQMAAANFLLGPVGFVLGYYFAQPGDNPRNLEGGPDGT